MDRYDADLLVFDSDEHGLDDHLKLPFEALSAFGPRRQGYRQSADRKPHPPPAVQTMAQPRRAWLIARTSHEVPSRGLGGTVPSGVFDLRDAESYVQSVEHPDGRKRRWVRCITGRSRELVRSAG